jgi:prophage maintenance system killer protein
LKRPTVELAIAINRSVRADDEWFEEPDDIDRVRQAFAAIDHLQDPVVAAAVLAYRVTRAQAFGEANKRTALLLARWLLDRNGFDGTRIIPPDDFTLADLLIRAAAGADVEGQIVTIFRERAQEPGNHWPTR